MSGKAEPVADFNPSPNNRGAGHRATLNRVFLLGIEVADLLLWRKRV